MKRPLISEWHRMLERSIPGSTLNDFEIAVAHLKREIGRALRLEQIEKFLNKVIGLKK